MSCDPDMLQQVPLFSLLDAEERQVLASRLALRRYDAGQQIYKMRSEGGRAYVVLNGRVRLTTIDDDNQQVVVDDLDGGGFFGFASLLDGSPHQTEATAVDETRCMEIDREDLETLVRAKPGAAMDMLAVLGKQIHATQELVRKRSLRSSNALIESSATFGERVADTVARFGGSWTFIILFAVLLSIYTAANVMLGKQAWDPYPFILLNLFLSMLAAIQAPVIMMSQNRQDMKDRLRGELDFEVNRRAELEVRALAGQVNEMRDLVADLKEQLRSGRGGIY